MKVLKIISIIVLAILLALFIGYCINGSLEMYPTPEKDSAVRMVCGIISLALAIPEVLLIKSFLKEQ